jgi:hypothetical protein
MYRKQYSKLEFTPSSHNHVQLKQEARFKHTYACIFKTQSNNPIIELNDQLLAARKYKFLYLKSQYINKPIYHLKYKKP